MEKKCKKITNVVMIVDTHTLRSKIKNRKSRENKEIIT